MKDYKKIANEIGQLLDEKQAAYGNAFGRMEALLHILYPDGIQSYQYKDLLTLVRMLDKVFRIANLPESQKDLMGEEPWKDICGYSLLALANQEKD